MTDSASISLLFPASISPQNRAKNEVLYDDLNLKRLVRSIALSPQYESYVRGILLSLTSDVQVIRYRQMILDDLLAHPALVDQLQHLLEEIILLESYLQTPQWKENVLRQVAWRLSELQRYVDTVLALHDILQQAKATIQSDGLKRLTRYVESTVQSDVFQQLQSELPDLLPRIRNIRSITVGINLDLDMKPLSATLLDTHNVLFTNETMLSRLFGNRETGIEVDSKLHDARFIQGLQDYQVELDDRHSPFMPPLFKDLSELLDETSRPVARALHKYTQINSRVLVALKMDIAFYLGAVKAFNKIKEAGMSICQPKIAPIADRKMTINGLYNINLLFQQFAKTKAKTQIIGNDVDFGADGRIFILTGPNQGGKTTYTRAVGLAQLLAQSGLYVPADEAIISPVDQIYTHFASEERPNLEAGRLGEEAKRLNDIFKVATRHSLVLLNESLASTSATESLYLARDVVRAFRLLGVRAIFATHLHDLASGCDRLNETTEGDSKIISVVSQVQMIEEDQTVKRTYKIMPAPPNSKSYAVELAARFGISYDQLKSTIKKQG